MVTQRGTCPACHGNYAVGKNGNPYKHTDPRTEQPCEGARQAAMPDKAWHLYGAEIEQAGQATFPYLLVGPVHGGVLPEVDFIEGVTLPHLVSFNRKPTPAQLRAALPEPYASRIPDQVADAPAE